MKKILFLLNILSLKCLAASELYAGNEEINEVLKNDMYTPSYFKMFLGLIIVISLIYLVGIIYQKLTKVRIADSDSDKFRPEIISTTTLGQGKNIHIVKIMGEYILIGSTQNSITFLKDIKEDRAARGEQYE